MSSPSSLTAKKRSSAQDLKLKSRGQAIRKLGGQKEADELLIKWMGWEHHQQAEKNNERYRRNWGNNVIYIRFTFFQDEGRS